MIARAFTLLSVLFVLMCSVSTTNDLNRLTIGLVAWEGTVPAVALPVKMRSRKGLNIPSDTIEKTIERRINKKYKTTCPLYEPI
jgi:hypothetical protein